MKFSNSLKLFTVEDSLFHVYLNPRFNRFASSRKNIKSQTLNFHHMRKKSDILKSFKHRDALNAILHWY